jgi:hypothetical protein
VVGRSVRDRLGFVVLVLEVIELARVDAAESV